MYRRGFIETCFKAGAWALSAPLFSNFFEKRSVRTPIFKLALNQWSLFSSYVGDMNTENWWDSFYKLLHSNPAKILQGSLDPLDFPKLTRELYDLDAIEIEASLYFSRVDDIAYFREFKKRCNDYGVRCLFISNVWSGNLAGLGNTSPKAMAERYYRWVDLCAFLGCHSLMVNINGRKGDREVLKQNAIESLRILTEFSAKQNVHIITENHNWYSADPYWLSDIMDAVNHPYCGLNVDLGNFCGKGWRSGICEEPFDFYEGVKLLMPYARAVSAKTMHFDEDGNERNIDYYRMLRIIKDSGYDGYLGIEYSGDQFSNHEGIVRTLELINKASKQL